MTDEALLFLSNLIRKHSAIESTRFDHTSSTTANSHIQLNTPSFYSPEVAPQCLFTKNTTPHALRTPTIFYTLYQRIAVEFSSMHASLSLPASFSIATWPPPAAAYNHSSSRSTPFTIATSSALLSSNHCGLTLLCICLRYTNSGALSSNTTALIHSLLPSW